MSRTRLLPGFSLSLGLSVFYLSLIVLLPVSTLVLHASQIDFQTALYILTDPRLIAAMKVTLITAAVASVLNGFLGLLLAWILVRYEFWGRKLIDSLVDLPFALPTAVAGLTLSAIFAHNGWVGQWLAYADIRISYTIYGIILAMVFTSIPFVVRTLQPVLEDFSSQYEEAAECLGATRWQIFKDIIFPTIRPALMLGIGLSFVRSLGEFGAVIFIAGNKPFETEVLSLAVYTYIGEYNYPAATMVAFLIMLFSLIFLMLLQYFFVYRTKNEKSANES